MRWTIQSKLFFGFGLAAVLLLAENGVAHWAQTREQATQQAITQTYGMLNDLQYLIAYVRGVTVAQRAYMISGDEQAIAVIPAMRKDADAVAARVQQAIQDDPAQLDHFSRYLDAVRLRRAFVNQLNTARKEQGFDAAKALFDTGEDVRLLQGMEDEFAAMKARSQEQLSAQQAANAALQRTIAWVELAGVLVGTGLLIIAALGLIRSITKNLAISVELVGAMARKDLAGPDGESASNDELAGVIEAINRMKHEMTGALAEVALTSAQVASAGCEIEATTREIAAATRSEQQNVESFAAAVAQFDAAIREVAENSEQASQSVVDAVSVTASGRAMVEQTREALDRIAETVTAASANISALGQQTQGIGEVVQIIEEIAGQTNLLALNAAIEAARAGEHGKGFAVVAQEVRVLAERTSQFTKQIAEKIDRVQSDARRAVQSVGQGEEVVGEGMKRFNQLATALRAVTNNVQTAQEAIAMIATAAVEQSAATAGLSENIHQISLQVTQNTQQADQAATACAELARLAAGLQRIVEGFHLPEKTPAAEFQQVHKMAA